MDEERLEEQEPLKLGPGYADAGTVGESTVTFGLKSINYWASCRVCTVRTRVGLVYRSRTGDYKRTVVFPLCGMCWGRIEEKLEKKFQEEVAAGAVRKTEEVREGPARGEAEDQSGA